MIARFSFLLSDNVFIPIDDKLQSFEIPVSGYRVLVHPPYWCGAPREALDLLSPTPLRRISEALCRAPETCVTEALLINGKPTAVADALRLDFLQTHDFTRLARNTASEVDSWTDADPPAFLALSVANQVINRVRVVIGAAYIRPLTRETTVFSLQYLHDDGSEIPLDERIRGIHLTAVSLRATTLRDEGWHRVAHLPANYEPPSWELLLLDAYAALPDIGASIVLANAGLEVMITQMLHSLAARSNNVPEMLWKWINNRDHWSKEPSVAEKFDTLLKCFVGSSLNDEPQLWRAFKELRDARNSLVHQGAARIGDQAVQVPDAERLVKQAQDIAAWVDARLPEGLKRPRFVKPFTFTTVKSYVPGKVPATSRLVAKAQRGHEDTRVQINEPNDSPRE